MTGLTCGSEVEGLPFFPPSADTQLGCGEKVQRWKPGLVLRHSWRVGLAVAAVCREKQGETSSVREG